MTGVTSRHPRRNDRATRAAALLDRASDLLEDGVDLDASGRDGSDGDERNQGHEQCVLEQVLSFITSRQPFDELMDASHLLFLSVGPATSMLLGRS